MNAVKKYSPLNAEFSDLPIPVREILVHTFDKLDKLQFEKLRELGSLDHPNGNILDYELLAENQLDDEPTNDNSQYPPDLTYSETDDNHNEIINSVETAENLESKQESIDQPKHSKEQSAEDTKPKKIKAEGTPFTIKTRAAKRKEILESESDSDLEESKKVSFDLKA